MFRRWLGWFQRAPRFVFAASIILVSTAIFGIWLVAHYLTKPHPVSAQDDAAGRAATAKQAAKAEARIDYLFLADDDLYDAGNGELIFKRWLKGDHPNRLFYDPQSKKIFGQFEKGFARYAFDGTREAEMAQKNTPAFFDGFKHAVFVKDKNVWMADCDWQKFKFTNERQVTTMGVFYENYFAENIQLLTPKTLVVRNLNNELRVNLENGDVHPTRIPLENIAKRRSSDSRWVVGTLNGQFYCYNVDSDQTQTIPIGRNGINDYQWLGNDECLGLADQKEVVVYDRLANRFTDVMPLPFSCFKMAEPSPDGRYIFCAGGMDGRNGVLVDLETRTTDKVSGGAGITWVSNDTFALTRDVWDSDLRGTWLKKVREKELLVSKDPYLVSFTKAEAKFLLTPQIFIFSTRDHITAIDYYKKKVRLLISVSKPRTLNTIARTRYDDHL